MMSVGTSIAFKPLGDTRPHPEERACRRRSASANARARVSKDENDPVHAPSCFETHRSALRRWNPLRSRRTAMLLSMRARVRSVFWRNEATMVVAKRTRLHSYRRASFFICGGDDNSQQESVGAKSVWTWSNSNETQRAHFSSNGNSMRIDHGALVLER